MIIAIDTETGGIEPGKSALLSISACYYDQPEKTFNVYINPDPSLEINAEAAKVNGYTPELWQERGAIPLREALFRFKNWLPRSGNAPLGHNANFDRGFIEAAEKQTGFSTYLQRRWRCSMGSFMFVNDVLNLNPPDFKLETLAKMAGHWKEGFVRGAHQSIDDVTACAAGYKWLRGLFDKKEPNDAELF
jgi:DNA polymerase III epsilon subunit-like protein